MMVFVYYGAALLFFLSLLAGVFKGDPLSSLLLRSFGIYLWVLFLGYLASKVCDAVGLTSSRPGQGEEPVESGAGAETQRETPEPSGEGASVELSAEGKELADLKKNVAVDPKKAAEKIKGMMK
ncbi:MAG: hypothetical protein GF333_05100 [Candidatus Omnitrophica bacterium]|nr:hypothetical protein [Candidatus Omnitrophota bacterium]